MTVPIVLLHAASQTGKLWLPVTGRLTDFDTCAPDLPGHGMRAGEQFTWTAAVETVRAVLDTNHSDRALLVGASLGGLVSIAFAAQYPERVAGMVLSGCTFNPCRPLAQLILTGESVVFVRGATWFARRFHRWLRAHYPPGLANAMIDGGAYWHAASQAVQAMRGVDFRARLSAYRGPTLILNGARDVVHRSSEREFARITRQCQLKIIDGAGHVPHLDAPAQYADAVRQFANNIR